jgi:hypothetical protein
LFAEALPEFSEAARLTNLQDPAILQMLAAMQSETGHYNDAITTAQSALKLARQQQNMTLAKSLEANLERYQAQASADGSR